jgi:hypothetical protein
MPTSSAWWYRKARPEPKRAPAASALAPSRVAPLVLLGCLRAGAFCRDVTKGPVCRRVAHELTSRRTPAQRYICAHSTRHLRPLVGTSPPTRRRCISAESTPGFCRDVTKGPVLPACRARIDVSAPKPAPAAISARSTGHLRPLDQTSPPTRPDISARSTGHLCPLGRTSPPARPDISAHSAGHLRPVDQASLPARRDISARSAGHLRPLGRTSLPTRRVRSQPRSRASQAAASLKSESAVPAVTDVTTESARGYEPRNLTSSEVRRSPISASPTRASAT